MSTLVVQLKTIETLRIVDSDTGKVLFISVAPRQTGKATRITVTADKSYKIDRVELKGSMSDAKKTKP